MAASEGIRRIEVLAKLFVFGGIGSGLIGLGAVLFAYTSDRFLTDRFLSHRIEAGIGWIPAMMFTPAFPMILLGGGLWMLAWILEGFSLSSK